MDSDSSDTPDRPTDPNQPAAPDATPSARRSRRVVTIVSVLVALLVVGALTAVLLVRSRSASSGQDGRPSASSSPSAGSSASGSSRGDSANGSGASGSGSATRRYPPVSGSSHVESVTYRTRYAGRAYRKTAYVYLPAGYQASGSRRYDVLYLLHGWGGSASDFVGTPGSLSNTARRIDQLIANGTIPPLIVVSPTYYPTGRVSTSSYFEDRPLNLRFARAELPDDLMPAVEGRYRTYARSTTPEGFRASRAHRAFGGFSMGSITTWFVFQYDLADFSKFMPMAGDSWTQGSDGGGSDPNDTAAALADAARDQASRGGFPVTDFRIAASVGGADGTQGSTDPQIGAMRGRHGQVFTSETLNYRKDPNGGHDEQSCIAQLTFDLPWLYR